MPYSPIPAGDQVWPAAGVVIAFFVALGMFVGWVLKSTRRYLDSRFDRLESHNRKTRRMAKRALLRAEEAHVRIDGRRADDLNVR